MSEVYPSPSTGNYHWEKKSGKEAQLGGATEQLGNVNPSGWNRSRRKALIILGLSIQQDGAGLLADQPACRTRKRFQPRRLLSVPKEKPFPSVRNVSGAPDRPQEEIPGLGSGCVAHVGRTKKTDYARALTIPKAVRTPLRQVLAP